MLYLCEIRTRLPADMDPEAQARLLGDERERGEELVRSGRLRAIWRVVGSFANVSIWDAADNQELHEILASLPLWRYQDVSVRPLSLHPLTSLADSIRIP